jgi:molecular chaperone GrpE
MGPTEQNQPESSRDSTQPNAGQGDVAQENANAADLNRQLEEARGKVDEYRDAMLRANAELDNVRKRTQRDVENAHKFALERFAHELLPVKDSLEMGVAAASSDHPDMAKLREGTELTLKLLGGVLEKFGIREINPVGETFNPEWHQAISMQPAPDKQPNTVLVVMQKGYLLNDRLLRPAMVVVSAAMPGGDGNNGVSAGKYVDEQA